MKVGTKVWHIDIRNAKEEKSYSKNGITISEHEVIGISKFKICINDDWFRTFSHLKEGERKQRHNTYLNDTNVFIRTNNHLLGDGVFIELYTTVKPKKSTITKMVATANAKIDKEFGWLMGNVKEQLYEMADNFLNENKL